MVGDDPIGQEIAQLFLRPALNDELRDEVQVGARVHVVRDARGDDRQDGGDPLAAIVEPGEQPVLPAEDSDPFILPASAKPPRSTTRGTR